MLTVNAQQNDSWQTRQAFILVGKLNCCLVGGKLFFNARNEIGTFGKKQTNKQKSQLRESSDKLFMSFVILALSISERRL